MIIKTICPIDSTSAVCGTIYSAEILKTSDSGQSWSRVHIGDGTKYCGIYAIAKSPTTGTLVATTGDSQTLVLRSTDDGDTWTEIQQLTSEVRGYCVVGLDNGRFLAGTGHADSDLWKSDDDGLTWTFVVDFGQVRTYSLCDCGGGVVLAGTGVNEYIYRSTDYGSSWGAAIDASTSTAYVATLFKIPGTDIVLAGCGSPATIARSINNGVSFSVGQRLASSGYVTAFCMYGASVFACTQEVGEIWKSVDNGLTWSLVHKYPCSEAVVSELKVLESGVFLAGGSHVGWPMVSSDGGVTFSFARIYPENAAIMFPQPFTPSAYGLLDIPMHDESLYTTMTIGSPFASFASNVTFAAGDLSFPALSGTFQQPFRAAYFNGTSAVINLDNNVGSSVTLTTRANFVCSFWFRPETIPTTDQVVFRTVTSSTFAGVQVKYMSDGGTGAKIQVQMRSYQETVVTTEYVFTTSPVDTWKHVAIGWKYGTSGTGYVLLFVDGVQVAQTTGASFTYAYFRYVATPTHHDSIGASHDGTTATLFYKGHLALLTFDYSDNERIVTAIPAARYAAICGGFKDVHTHNLNSTMFSANNLRI